MIVYIVFSTFCFDTELEDVFSTEEKAQEYIKQKLTQKHLNIALTNYFIETAEVH